MSIRLFTSRTDKYNIISLNSGTLKIHIFFILCGNRISLRIPLFNYVMLYLKSIVVVKIKESPLLPLLR